MNGAQMLAGQAVIFLIAIGGIVLFSMLMLRFAGPALNRGRAAPARLAYAAASLLCLIGIVASAAGGFLAIAYLLYTAQP